jgi:hypothetical protein
MFYRILLALALIAAAVMSFFFLWGLADGSLYGDAGLAFLFVALAWGLIGGSLALRRRAAPVAPHLLLVPIVFPAVMYGLIILIFVLSGETWR